MASFTGTNAADNFVGADDVIDTFKFTLANLQADDTVSGGGGSVSDILRLTDGGTLPAARLAGVTGIETVDLAAAGNTITLLDTLAASATSQAMTVIGAAGNDFVDATAFIGTQSLIARGGGGADTLKGGAGGDRFEFNVGQLNGSDVVEAGAGFDVLRFLTAGEIDEARLAGVQGIERVELAAAGSVITLAPAFVATSQNGRIVVRGGAGNDVVDGTALSSTAAIVTEGGGGADRVLGGAGADIFRFAAAELSDADTVSGAGGSDAIELQTGGTVAAADLANVTGVGRIKLSDAGNTITLTEAFAASGDSINIFVQGTGSGNDVVDASGVTSEAIEFTLAAGNDQVTGGAGGDEFRVAPGVLNGNDTINGGGGGDNLILTAAGNVGPAKLANVSEIEFITLAPEGNSLQLSAEFQRENSGNAVIAVFGRDGNDTVDASAFGLNKPGFPAFAALQVSAGAGNDVLTGGATDDAFQFTFTELTGADVVNGGGGTRDSLVIFGSGALSAAALAGVTRIERIDLTRASGATEVTLDRDMVAASDEPSTIIILGGADDNKVLAAATVVGQAVQFVAGAGDDSIIGGAGNDIFEIAANEVGAGDVFTNGGFNDVVRLTGSGTVNASQMAGLLDGVGTLIVSAGGLAEIIVAPTPESATTLRLDSSVLDEGRKLRVESKGDDTIDLSAVGNGRLVSVVAGGGSDNLIGSGGKDFFLFDVTQLSTVPFNSFPQTGDTVDGRGGIDELLFTTAGTINSSFLSRVESMEKFVLSNFGNSLVLNDEVLANNRIGSFFFVESGTGDDVVMMPSQSTVRLSFTSGGGSDMVVGGSASDAFQFKNASLNANDFVDGGAGNDRIILTDMSFNFDGTAQNSLRSIESVRLTSSDPGFSETVTIDLDDVLSVKARNTDVLGTTFDNVLIIEGNDPDDRVVIDTGPGGPDLTVIGDFAFGSDVFRFFSAGAGGAAVLAVDRDFLNGV